MAGQLSYFNPRDYVLAISDQDNQILDEVDFTIGKQVHAEIQPEINSAWHRRHQYASPSIPLPQCFYTMGLGPMVDAKPDEMMSKGATAACIIKDKVATLPGQNHLVWKTGACKDGSTLAPGAYRIRIESQDKLYDGSLHAQRKSAILVRGLEVEPNAAVGSS